MEELSTMTPWATVINTYFKFQGKNHCAVLCLRNLTYRNSPPYLYLKIQSLTPHQTIPCEILVFFLQTNPNQVTVERLALQANILSSAKIHKSRIT